MKTNYNMTREYHYLRAWDKWKRNKNRRIVKTLLKIWD